MSNNFEMTVILNWLTTATTDTENSFISLFYVRRFGGLASILQQAIILSEMYSHASHLYVFGLTPFWELGKVPHVPFSFDCLWLEIRRTCHLWYVFSSLLLPPASSIISILVGSFLSKMSAGYCQWFSAIIVKLYIVLLSNRMWHQWNWTWPRFSIIFFNRDGVTFKGLLATC